MSGPERYDRVLRFSERVYRALLFVCPGEFRREYGPRMVQAFRDLCREEIRHGGIAGVLGLWSRTVLDLTKTALGEWSSRRANDEEVVVKDYKVAGVGFVLLLAPLYFVSASLLKYGLGVGFLFDPLEAFLSVSQRRDVFNLISPLVFLGGLTLALALNAYAVLGLNVGRENGTIVSTVRLRIKPLNLAVASTSALLLFTLVGYVFLENFSPNADSLAS